MNELVCRVVPVTLTPNTSYIRAIALPKQYQDTVSLYIPPVKNQTLLLTQMERGLFLTQMENGNRLGPAMKTMTLALAQMGFDIPDALGVIGKTRTLHLSGCPIALSQLVCVNVVINYHSTTAWPRDESLAAALYISNFPM